MSVKAARRKQQQARAAGMRRDRLAKGGAEAEKQRARDFKMARGREIQRILRQKKKLDEAVTRTNDGKFATQGPCPESGCGRERGHAGRHLGRAAQYQADLKVDPEWARVIAEDPMAQNPEESPETPREIISRLVRGARPSNERMWEDMDDDYAGADRHLPYHWMVPTSGAYAMKVAAASLWGGETFGEKAYDQRFNKPETLAQRKATVERFTQERLKGVSTTETMQGLRDYLQAQHAYTQARFAASGSGKEPGRTVTLYRSVRFPPEVLAKLKWKDGDQVEVKVGALSSFADHPNSANIFGGTTLAVEVPLSHVVGRYDYGLGDRGEHEWVVAGDNRKMTARVLHATPIMKWSNSEAVESPPPPGVRLIPNLDAFDQDWLRRRGAVATEAVTRTQDGKFASQGPCPESGCGRGQGHGGAHGPRHPIEREVAVDPAWRDQVRAAKARAITADAGTILLDLVRTTPEPNPLNGLVIQQDWRTGSSFGELSLRVAASTLWGGEVFSSIWTRTGIPAPLRRDHWPEALDEFRKLNMEGDYRPERLLAHFQDYLQAQHALTQSYDLGDPTKDTVTLYRGVSLPIKGTMSPGRIGRLLQGWAEGKDVEVKLGALSSFSERRDIAESFGPIVLEIQVPKNHIVANYRTGLGVEREKEWVVAGDQTKFKAKILRMPSWWKTPQWTPETAATSMATQEAVEDSTVNLDELDQDWLRRRTHQEAVTRDADGKFASQGPCPESGCGRRDGHTGAHGPTSDGDLPDASGWEPVSGTAATHTFHGGFYRAPSGQVYYVKGAADDEHLRIEALANRLYRQAGVPVAKGFLVQQGDALRYASERVSGSSVDEADVAHHPDVMAGFGVDAWLGAWDVAGMDFSNLILTPDGHIVRVDHGGSLHRRAQGGVKKPMQWTAAVPELASLRNRDLNPGAGAMFEGMRQEDMARAIARVVERISDAAIDRHVAAVGLPAKDATILKARRATLRTWLQDHGVTVSEAVTRTQDGKFASNGPCAETGCGFAKGHKGAHAARWTHEGTEAEALAAIQNTPGAKIGPEGITLDIARFQNPEQAGAKALRTGVFYLPELKSPYRKYYSGDKAGYGGSQFVTNRVTLQNPLIVKAGTGGTAIVKAYDLLLGRGAYEAMRSDVLKSTVGAMLPMVRTNPNGSREERLVFWGALGHEQQTAAVADLLTRYGGAPTLASDIVRHSTQGNTLAYALQEHIAAFAIRKAGYDSVLSYSKAKGQPRLAEVFHLGHTHYPTVSLSRIGMREALEDLDDDLTWDDDPPWWVVEAVTRTQDGKFATQGPCPESGCGRDAGHAGAHRPRQATVERDVMADPEWLKLLRDAVADKRAELPPTVAAPGIIGQTQFEYNSWQASMEAIQAAIRERMDLAQEQAPTDKKTAMRAKINAEISARQISNQWVTSTSTSEAIALRGAAQKLWGGEVFLSGMLMKKGGTGGIDFFAKGAVAADNRPKGMTGDNVTDALGDYLKAQHAWTQMLLMRAPETITLYRGISLPSDEKLNVRDRAYLPLLKTWRPGAEVNVKLGALSSLTAREGVADSFGRWTLKVEVPKEYVVGYHLTGLGSHAEAEWVVAGDLHKFKATITKVPSEVHGYQQAQAKTATEAIEPDADVVNLDELDQDWLVRARAQAQQEAVTRTEDGKFASNGPCPEFGCRKEAGHLAMHDTPIFDVPHKGERPVEPDAYWAERIREAFAAGRVADPSDDVEDEEDLTAQADNARAALAKILQGADDVNPDLLQVLGERQFAGSWEVGSSRYITQTLRGAAQALWGGEIFSGTAGTLGKVLGPNEISLAASQEAAVATAKTDGKASFDAEGVMHHATKYLQAQHAWTQTMLEDRGYADPDDPVYLFRAIHLPDRHRNLLKGWENGKMVQVKVGALSSLTEDEQTARSFGPLLLKIRVPRRYVVGTATLGLGDTEEQEWVVAGDNKKFHAQIVRMPSAASLKPPSVQTEAQDEGEDVLNLDALDPDWLRRETATTESLAEYIVKVPEGYRIISHETGKNLGTFKTRKAAEKHLRHLAQFREAWDETQHPRVQAGSPEGGQFTAGGGGGRATQGPTSDAAGWHTPTAEEFIAARNASKRAGFLSPLNPEGLADRTLVLGYGGKVGYALDPQGDIENLFNNDGPPGAGREAMFHALDQGGQTLDCFDGFLPDLYAQYGFQETGRVKFNREYAPPGWNYDKYDDPDVVMMAWEGYPDGRAATRARVEGPRDDWRIHADSPRYFEDWDTAKADSRRAVGAGHRVTAEGRGLGRAARGVDLGAGARDGGTLAEAVTRTHDGKFATQGPCPEDGCGLGKGHAGAHSAPNPVLTAERDYPPIPTSGVVDGREIIWHRDIEGALSNYSSISASLGNDWDELDGIRVVRLNQFDDDETPSFYSRTEEDRVSALADAIRESGQIEPLIVVIDRKGPYILEGGHRYDALRLLKAKAFPALVVRDTSSLSEAVTRTTDGKFATDGPCPAAGCGLRPEHPGPHRVLSDAEKRARAVADQIVAAAQGAEDAAAARAAEGPRGDAVPTFTTMKQARTWMKEHYPGVAFFEKTNKPFDPATVTALVTSWHDLAQRFPEVATQIDAITNKGFNAKSRAVAAASEKFFLNRQTGRLRRERSLQFNPAYLAPHSIAGQPSILGASGKRMFENGWLASPEPEAFMSHEFGHMVDFVHQPRVAKEFIGRLRVETLDTPSGKMLGEWKATAKRAGQAPSKYAETDRDELFAESFSAWHMKSLGKQYRASPTVDSMGTLLQQARAISDPAQADRSANILRKRDVQEAVTRTEDGKFASQGPCPESGCGRHQGHEGAHGPGRDPETLRPHDYQPAPAFTSTEDIQRFFDEHYPDLNVGRFMADAEAYDLVTLSTLTATWHDLAQRFPDVAKTISRLDVDGPWSEDLGASRTMLAAADYYPGQAKITFNPYMLRGDDGLTLEGASQEGHKNGFLAVGGAAGVMAHEFGHIAQYHFERLHEDALVPAISLSGFGLAGDAVRAWTSYNLAARNAPSEYAKTNDREFFAESFAAWHALTSGNKANASEAGAVDTIDDLLRAIETRRKGQGSWTWSAAEAPPDVLAAWKGLTDRLGLPASFATQDWASAVKAMKKGKKRA